MPADILSEILITAMIDQDSNHKNKGCSPWFWIFLIAVAIWIAYMFLKE